MNHVKEKIMGLTTAGLLALGSSIFTVNSAWAINDQSATLLLPIGSWKSESGRTSLTFLQPSMYQLDIDGDGRVDSEGTVLLEGGKAIFRETLSKGSFNGCSGNYGVYTLSMGDAPRLAIVRDACGSRAALLTQHWSSSNGAATPRVPVPSPAM